VPPGKDVHLDHQDLVMVWPASDLLIVTVHVAYDRPEFFPVDYVTELSQLIA
jgi:hypothetical protein